MIGWITIEDIGAVFQSSCNLQPKHLNPFGTFTLDRKREISGMKSIDAYKSI